MGQPDNRDKWKACQCKEWKENVPKIDNVLAFVQTTRNWKLDDLVPFRVCPWCGKKLTETED